MRVLREYLVRAVGGNTPQKSFCRLFSLSYPRMEQLVSTLYAINRCVCACVCVRVCACVCVCVFFFSFASPALSG